MSYIVVIPARYKSTRLPGKPLVSILGIPMIVRTWLRCVSVVPRDLVYVATDDDRIASVCIENGIQVIMTSSDCLTGTDRIAEVANHIMVDTYINVQGDEPIFNPDDLLKLLDYSQKYPDDVINGYCAISNEDMFYSSSTPKVVFRPDGRLLYMSRASIPTNKTLDFIKAWRQVCAYAFPREALFKFAEGTKTSIEEIEDIEILRFLEKGFEVRMIEMSSSSVAVDHPDDVLKAEQAILLEERISKND